MKLCAFHENGQRRDPDPSRRMLHKTKARVWGKHSTVGMDNLFFSPPKRLKEPYVNYSQIPLNLEPRISENTFFFTEFYIENSSGSCCKIGAYQDLNEENKL